MIFGLGVQIIPVSGFHSPSILTFCFTFGISISNKKQKSKRLMKGRACDFQANHLTIFHGSHLETTTLPEINMEPKDHPGWNWKIIWTKPQWLVASSR